MCKPHWREYTNALRKAAVGAEGGAEPLVAVEAEPEPVPEPAAEPMDEAECRSGTGPAAPRPSRRGKPRRPSSSRPPSRHTKGPGRESGACLRPVWSGRHRRVSGALGGPVGGTRRPAGYSKRRSSGKDIPEADGPTWVHLARTVRKGVQMRHIMRGAAVVVAMLVIGVPAAAQSEPLVLERSVTVEEDGIRLTMAIERNPVVAGEPVWITTKLTNTGKDDIVWGNGHCDATVLVSGAMKDQVWRDGLPAGPQDYDDFKYYTTYWRIDAGPIIRLEIEPKGSLRTGGYGCSEIGYTDRIPPGMTFTDRSRWDGYAQWQLGLPPSGVATIIGEFENYKRAGESGRRSISASLDVLIVDGLAEDRLHPMEIVDAAVADPGLAPLLRLGDGKEPIVQYDADLDLWNVGVLEHGGRTRYWERFTGGLVDPVTGDVVALIDRPWIPNQDPRPDSA